MKTKDELNNTKSRIARLKDKAYRDAFVASQISVGLPFQIRSLREKRNMKQADLAQKTGMLQPRISAMESPGGARFTLETLRRIASAFDVALIVRFAPFSEVLGWSERFHPDEFSVPSFEEDFTNYPMGNDYLTTQLGATISSLVTFSKSTNAISVTSADAPRSQISVSGGLVVLSENGNVNLGIPKMPPSQETSQKILWGGMEAGNTAYVGTR